MIDTTPPPTEAEIDETLELLYLLKQGLNLIVVGLDRMIARRKARARP
jgi:hypothetical protein